MPSYQIKLSENDVALVTSHSSGIPWLILFFVGKHTPINAPNPNAEVFSGYDAGLYSSLEPPVVLSIDMEF